MVHVDASLCSYSLVMLLLLSSFFELLHGLLLPDLWLCIRIVVMSTFELLLRWHLVQVLVADETLLNELVLSDLVTLGSLG